jgi:predicted phosphodiesterase
MRPMRIVHTADIHLRDTRDARWAALASVVTAAEGARARVLVIAGDLFDRDIDAPSLKTALRPVLERFSGDVVVIPGNHDAGGIRAGDFFGDNVRVLAGDDVITDVDGVRFVGLPFEDAGIDGTLARLRAASRRRGDGTNLLLYHGELLDLAPGSGAFGDEDGREYMPARLADLGELGFDYVLAGHFHKNFDVRACGEGYFVYSGSPVSIPRRETGRRRVTLIETGSAPDAIALDTHHYQAIDIRYAPADPGHPLERLQGELATLANGATGLVTLRGFTDLSRFGVTEQAFQAGIKDACARYPVESCDASACNDVGGIVSGDLFRRFEEKLSTSPLSDEDRVRVREMTIRALIEVPDAR